MSSTPLLALAAFGYAGLATLALEALGHLVHAALVLLHALVQARPLALRLLLPPPRQLLAALLALA